MATTFISETPTSETHTDSLFRALRTEPVGTWLIAGEYPTGGRSSNFLRAAKRRKLHVELTERTRTNTDGSRTHRVYIRLAGRP